MKVILLKDVKNVGKKYEVKDVADGFAMNSLIPRNLALSATDGSLRKVEDLKSQDEGARKGREEEISKNLTAVEGVRIVWKGKGNEQGHLFAGVHADDIVDELRKQSGLQIEADHIALEKPIKEVGEHKIAVEVGGKSSLFTLVVETE